VRYYDAEQLLLLFERSTIHALRARLDAMGIEYRYTAVPYRLQVAAHDLPDAFRAKAETLFTPEWVANRRRHR
jgi:hypothetical protein